MLLTQSGRSRTGRSGSGESGSEQLASGREDWRALLADSITTRNLPWAGARRRIVILSALLLLTVAITISAVESNAAGSPEDEGLLLVYPELILHGQAPFGSFQSSYGPGAYLPLAAVYAVTGPNVTVERTVGTVYKLAIIAVIAWVAWPLGELAALTGAVLVFLAIFFDGPPAAVGWFFALACMIAAIATARAAGPRTMLWALAGLLAGVAASARFDFAVALAAAMGIMLLRASWRARAAFLAGVLLGAAALVWDLLAAGPSNLWTYAVQARLNQLGASGYQFPTGLAEFLLLAAMTGLVLMVAIRVLRRDGWTPVTAAWLALAVIGVLLLPQMLQRPDSGHFVYVIPVTIGLLPLAFAEIRQSRLRRSAAAFAAVAILSGSGLAIGDPAVNVRHDGRSFPYSTTFAPADVQAMLAWTTAHVRGTPRLFVGTRDLRWPLEANTALYYLQPNLPHAGFYLELGPGETTQTFERRIIAELARAQVLELDATDYRQVWPEARADSDLPNRIVTRDFTEAFRAGPYSIWLRHRP